MIAWIERNRGHILVTFINLAALGAVVFWLRQPAPGEMVVPMSAATVATEAAPTPAPVRVYVTGAVHDPDVYILPDGSMVKDAVAAAGGSLPEADLNHVNLAQGVFDQEQLYVPFLGEIDEPPLVESGSGSRSGGLVVEMRAPVNINTATASDLEALPGIGPGLAERIVAYRSSHRNSRPGSPRLQAWGGKAALC